MFVDASLKSISPCFADSLMNYCAQATQWVLEDTELIMDCLSIQLASLSHLHVQGKEVGQCAFRVVFNCEMFPLVKYLCGYWKPLED